MRVIEVVPPPAASRTEIRVGSGVLADLATIVGRERLLIVVDARLEATGHLAKLPGVTGADVAVIAGGEAAKSIGTAESLWNRWLGAGAGRDSVVIAFGGGSVCDVAGFAAACFMRGVSWIALPTTILAMSDAAIGGKTGVNLAAGKNLAGAVHHPRAVLADLDMLATLPEMEYADGWAEVIKAGVIGDLKLLEAVEAGMTRIRVRDAAIVEDLLARAIRVKADVVEADPSELSRREILNFGHTVGHALERACPGLSHGRAVALGMGAEAWLAEDSGRLPGGTARRILAACEGVGIALGMPHALSELDFLSALAVDKKRRDGRLRVALPSGLGAHDEAPGVIVEAANLLACLGRS